MINGIHTLIYSKHPESVRTFLKDVLSLPSVDAGEGWLIFASPPAEIAVHPTEEEGYHELYLMCDDIEKATQLLSGKGVKILRPIADRGWGLVTTIRLSGGDEFGLYQPKHPTAIKLSTNLKR